MKKIILAALVMLATGLVRADTTTTRLGITKPSIGSTGWGTKWNTNADLMDVGFGVVSATNTWQLPQTFTGQINASSHVVVAGTISASSNVVVTGNLSVTAAATHSSTTTLGGAVLDRNLTAGTTWDMLRSSGSAQAPIWSHAGLILQSTQCFALNPSTASSTAVFGASSIKVTLTPKFSNSLMRIYFHGMLSNSSPTGDTCEISLFKNGTNILGGTNDWSRYSMTNASNANFEVVIGPYNDTSSASAITYQIYIRNSAGGSTCTLGSAGGVGLLVDEIGQ